MAKFVAIVLLALVAVAVAKPLGIGGFGVSKHMSSSHIMSPMLGLGYGMMGHHAIHHSIGMGHGMLYPGLGMYGLWG